jgi:glycosyltransferase involved in cell wall biosynthesis
VAAQNRVFKRMARYAFTQAGLITANSDALRDVAVNELGADPGRFELIAYGVDPDALLPDPGGAAEIRGELGIPSAAVVLLAVGRMVYKKGFDRLLRAAALLAETGGSDLAALPPIHLVLVGEGDLWSEWQALGRELGLAPRAHWVGNIPADRIGAFYNMADVLVMPSVTKPADGLNVTVLDAMACAKPVVGTDAAGNTLAVRDGLNGFIVPEDDTQALAKALSALAADPGLRRRMGAEGRRLIEHELGWPQLARRYLAHFERLAEARRGRRS